MTHQQFPHLTDENYNWTLRYLSFRSDENSEFKYSLNPIDSDLIQNSTILGCLVGTLVKYAHSGRIEPYLAESFQVDENNRKWTFKLKSNLSCEDGRKIDSHRFVASLTSSLRRYAEQGDALDFESLVGWNEFKNNKLKLIKGLSADDDNNIIFNFVKPPSDLLEFLRMPYFGFWCESNFDDTTRKWKDDHSIVSSGAYSIVPSPAKDSLTLKLRKNSGFDGLESPSEIYFGKVTKGDLLKEHKNTIITFSRKSDVEEFHSELAKIVGPPTMLFALSLSPYFDGLFMDKQNRQIFADRIKVARQYFPEFSSSYFYFNAKTDLPNRDLSSKAFNVKKGSKLTFAVASKSFSGTDLNNVDKLLSLALRDSGLSYQIIVKDPHEDGWVHKVDSNKMFDARITSVDIGGYVINAAIKMMFCSKLGINFGDPSTKICKLVEEQDENGGPIPQSYVDEFNKIIHDDASVIPLYHYGIEWRLTPDLDTQSLPVVATEPIFEKIRRKIRNTAD